MKNILLLLLHDNENDNCVVVVGQI